MAEERPPTVEEISDLRSRLKSYITENGTEWYHPRDHERLMNSDDYVSRFFLHCTDIPGDHLKNTFDMILRSLKFRQEKDVRAIKSTDLDEGLKIKGSLYLRNRDVDGKQLLIFDVKKHIKGAANMDDMQRMFLYFLERVDREDEDGMVTIVFDCAGCGLKNMDMEFIRYMIDVLKDYYPWNLNYILVLDMPWVLNAAWKIIKAWLPAGAVKKIKFVNKNTVDDYVRPDQKLVAWAGSDPWQYEFVEESESQTMNGHSSNVSTSSDDEIIGSPIAASPIAASPVKESKPEVKAAAAPEPSVTFSLDKDKSHKDYEASPDYELIFLKGPKGLMATVSVTNKSDKAMAYKIKTTSPERYRVRPSLGLIAACSTIKIEVFYQPVSLDSDDYTDVLKDKFLINLFLDSSEATYKTDIKDKKPSYQHRLKASVKKSLLKTTPPATEKSNALIIDKDKDVYLKELKALDSKYQMMYDELKSTLMYTRLILLLTVIVAFMISFQFYFKSSSPCAQAGFSHLISDEDESMLPNSTIAHEL